MNEIPEKDIYVLYTIKNKSPIQNRFISFLKKFRKIEQFIREYDKNEKS